MTYKITKYQPEITIKKGFIAGLSVGIITLITTAILDGGITFQNALLNAVFISVIQALHNYYKHKDDQNE